MEDKAYESMGSQEDQNWYYQARLMIIKKLLRKHILDSPHRLRILAVGCGTGSTSIALGEYGDVVGIEPSLVALQILKQKIPGIDVRQGTVEDVVSLVGLQSQDLVTALGVLCHRGVRDPLSAVGQIADVLRAGGWFLWNDCIYPQLWREHDEFVHCGRRFYPRDMHDIRHRNGFEIVHSSNLLAWGTPVAFVLSLWYRFRTKMSGMRRVSKLHSDDRPLPGILNRFLRGLTVAEWNLGEGGLRFPFGVSRLILAKKR